MEFPTLLEVPSFPEGVDESGVGGQVRLESAIDHFVEQFECHVGIVVVDVGLHEGGVQVDVGHKFYGYMGWYWCRLP